MNGKLVVALVVVVAAVVLIGIIAYDTIGKSQPPRTPSASFSSAEKDSASTMKLTFREAESSLRYADLKMILHLNDTVDDAYLGTYPLDPNGTGDVNSIAGGQNYSISYDDVDSDGVVESGEHLGVEYLSGTLPAGDYTVYLVWACNGSVVTSALVPV
jgi:hypothetical protein